MPSQSPRVEAGYGRDAPFFQVIAQGLRLAKITGAQRQVTNDQPCCMDAGGLRVLGINPDIADVRIGQRDQLIAIGRIGQDFLIASHRRVEHDLADPDRIGADGCAPEHRTVSQGKNCGCERRQDNRPDVKSGAGLASTPLNLRLVQIIRFWCHQLNRGLSRLARQG